MQKATLLLFSLLLCASSIQSQQLDLLSKSTYHFSDIRNDTLTQYLGSILADCQFILLGESHGIVEVGEITHYLYDIAQPQGFNTLCIETDPFAAKTMMDFYAGEQSIVAAEALYQKYPFSIPFYDNYEDYKLLDAVMQNRGAIWGIDQSLMAEFRLIFDHIAQRTEDAALKSMALEELSKAVAGYRAAVDEKDFMKAYIFQFDSTLYRKMKALSDKPEISALLDDLWKTKEIYDYQFSGQYYFNNFVRAQLMKRNFMNYYRARNAAPDSNKVIFKLGYNHTGRGLTFTRMYDIGNMASELANANGMRSLHVLATGVSGIANRANPVEPEKAATPIMKSKYLPAAFYELADRSKQKYTVLKTEELRPMAQKFDEDIQKFLFKFDLIILIKDARPLTSLK